MTCGERLKDSLHFWKSFGVWLNRAQPGLVEIAEWSFAGENTAPNFFSDASANIAREVAHVLIGDAEFKRHQDHIVGGKIHSLEGANFFDRLALKQADYFSSVVEIAGDAVKRPTQNSIRFTAFDATKHVIEHRSARLLGAHALVESSDDGEILFASDLIQFLVLSINGKKLPVFILARFSAINEILEHGQIVAKDISDCELKMEKQRNQIISQELLLKLRGNSSEEKTLHRLHSVVLVLGGLSASEVGRRYGNSARSVAYWVTRFKESGVDGLKEELRSGRPMKLTPTQLKRVGSFVRQTSKSEDGSVTGKSLSTYILKSFGVSLTIRQCRRIMKQFLS